MSSHAFFTGAIDGFDFYGLRSDRVELRVVPELGAKVTHLLDLHRGREWMWHPADRKLFRRPLGAAFAEGPIGGLNECIPTIAACQWRGRRLPDHGEAWTEAWSIDQDAFAKGCITTRLQLPLTPLLIERAIRIDGARVVLNYALTNIGNETEEYLWAMHPLLTVRPGDRLRLPDEVKKVTTYLALASDLGPFGHTWSWPAPMPNRREDLLLSRNDPSAIKFFTPPLRRCWACVENEKTGDFLEICCDARELDTLGIWINRGGWNDYHHLAIEPTNGCPDDLDTAVTSWRRHGSLPPRVTRRWSVILNVENGIACDPSTA